jgi:hypothetical protein
LSAISQNRPLVMSSKPAKFEVCSRGLLRKLAGYEHTQNGRKAFDFSTFEAWMVASADCS